MAEIIIRETTSSDADLLGGFVFCLLCEFDPELNYALDPLAFGATAKSLLSSGGFWAYLACRGDEPVGGITISECASIYAGGQFGEIAELYIVPECRSAGIAPKLLDAARELGRQRGWTRLEVGAPPMPDWQRTYDFYVRNGFQEIGPRLKQYL